MSILKRSARRIPRSKQSALRLMPTIETFEERIVLSNAGFLQGTVFIDGNANSKLDPTDMVQAGALVKLYQNNTLVSSVTTGSDGSYLFTGLAPGNYQVVETPPQAYANSGTETNSPLNPILAGGTSSTINVQVVDPSQLTATYDSNDEFTRDAGYISLQASPDGGQTYITQNFTIGQLPFTVSGPGLAPAELSTYCVDVFNGLTDSPDSFTASGQSTSTTVNATGNAGRIGYLYQQYGSVLSATAPTLTSSQAFDQQALQLAIWKLEYDFGANLATFSSGNIQDISIIPYGSPILNDTLADLESRALQFISQSAGHSELATVLTAIPGTQNPTGAGYQDLLVSGSLNFANVAKASPAITTAATVAGTGQAGTSTLSDVAVLSGGTTPTGTIVFTLTAPDGTTTTVGSVTATGDGTYNSASVTATEVGNYTWHASYSGDANNNGAVDNGANEGVTTAKSNPAITTNAKVTGTGQVGTSTLSDVAVLSGGYQPGGTIVFTLTAPDGTTTTVGSVTATGDGTYNSASVTATEVGNYTWHASYSGDANNASAKDNGANEGVTTGKACPTIATVPSPMIATQGTTTTLTDTATLSGGYHESGTLYFGLYLGTTQVDLESVTVNGDGSYSTPKGYKLPSNAAAGIYQWDTYYVGDGNNNGATDLNNPAEQAAVLSQNCCNPQNVVFYVTTPGPNGKTTAYSSLGGNTDQGDTVSVSFTVPNGMYDQISLVGYTAPESSFYADDASQQVITQSVTQVYGPGAHTLGPITLPNSFYQVDFVCGTPIQTLGLNSNDFYSAQGRLMGSDNGGVNPVGSAPLSVAGTVYVDGNLDGKFDSNDQTLSGVKVTLTGTDAYGNGVSLITTTNAQGQYSFTGMPFSNSAGYTVTESMPSGDFSASATVGTAGGSGTTNTSPEGVSGIVLNSAAHATGTGYNMGVFLPSSVSGQIYDDTNSDGKFDCWDQALSGVTVTLSGTTYQNVAVSKTIQTDGSGDYSFAGLAPGYYTVSATPPGGLAAGTASVGTVSGTADGTAASNKLSIGTIGLGSSYQGVNYNFGLVGSSAGSCQTGNLSFWCGNQGQSLINCLNGGRNQTSLGNWLAANCPNLFGSLKGCSNSQVASCLSSWSNSSSKQANAQALCTALNVYVTSSSLAGNAAQSYGFTVSSWGLGTCSYNVGSNGNSLGLSNNSSCSVLSLLWQLDGQAKNGVINSSAYNCSNSIFAGINQI